MWHGSGGRFSPFRADGAENVAPDIAGVARGTGACSTLGPDTGERALLANPRFILKPYLQGLAAGCFRQGCFYALRRSWAAFKSLLCIRVGFRMLRAHRQTPKAQACQLFANSSLMPGDAEAALRSCKPLQCAARAQPHRFRGRQDPVAPFPPTPPSVPRSADRVDPAGDTNRPAHALRIVTVPLARSRSVCRSMPCFLPPSCGQPHPEPGQSSQHPSRRFPSSRQIAPLPGEARLRTCLCA